MLPTTTTNEGRKPRGKALEQTEFMKALDTDPAAAMMALADEAQGDWEDNAKPADAGMIGATEEL